MQSTEDFPDSNVDSTSTDEDSFSSNDVEYVEASPPNSEPVSSKVIEIVIPEVGRIEDDILLIKDDTLREKLIARIVKTLSFVIHQEFHIFSFIWESDILILSTNEVDIIKKTENQAKMTKLSMEWKRLCKIKAKVQKCQSQSQYNESAVKPEPELKNTIGCNLNPSDGPGKPNSITTKTVKTLKAQS
ncbi:hypothetical protein Tco_1132730 [Tanacetum coccineum]|uniref:Uncharacterized protein n=1 Tax=Tanacetum coccineum TaxID=301880 RepID=A0ABQ5JGU5_9ASTR